MDFTFADVTATRVSDFCCRWQVRELALIGSVARGDARPDSDVDVLVTFHPQAHWSLWELAAMREELQAILPRSVDLVEESALRNPFRRRAILRDKRVIYAG
jgi:hypothetical protein